MLGGPTISLGEDFVKERTWTDQWPTYAGIAIWCMFAWVAYRAMSYPEEFQAIFGTSLLLNLVTMPALISCWRRQSLTRDH